MFQVELHVPDFDVVERFYGELGFSVCWQTRSPGKSGYLVMRMGAIMVRFWPGNESITAHSYFGEFPPETPRGYGVELVCMVGNLDDVYARAQGLECVVGAMVVRPWGLRDFRIADPYGYYLRFTDPHDVASDDYLGQGAPLQDLPVQGL